MGPIKIPRCSVCRPNRGCGMHDPDFTRAVKSIAQDCKVKVDPSWFVDAS
jgi:hypothetical protein